MSDKFHRIEAGWRANGGEWIPKCEYDALWNELDILLARFGIAEREAEGYKASLQRYQDSPEHEARQRMVLDVIRAKREAGFPRTAAFFKDVWPVALAALKAERERATRDIDAPSWWPK